MNVLYAGTYPPHPGGSAVLMAQVLPRLLRHRCRVRVLAPITAETVAAGERYAASQPGIDVTRFEVSYYETMPDQAAPERYREIEAEGARRAMSQLVALERPDVVVSGRETFALHVPAAARAFGLPTLQVIQGGTTTGMLTGSLPSSTRDRLMAGFREAAELVAVARHLVPTYRDLGFDNVQAIQNGVDLRRFAPRPRSGAHLAALRIPPGALVLAHASNSKPLKRPFDLLAAAGALAREGIDFVALVIGDGPLRRPMEDACRSMGLSERFRFTGWIDHEEMPAYLNLTDIMVMPSESEALALVYLEVLACGRVLLASDISASREVVTDGHDGVLFRAGDVADLAARTVALARDTDRRDAIGARARRTAESHDIDATAAAYAQVLETIVSRHQSLSA
jgi:glycosyltransferase involved in cell wall biosynthesis